MVKATFLGKILIKENNNDMKNIPPIMPSRMMCLSFIKKFLMKILGLIINQTENDKNVKAKIIAKTTFIFLNFIAQFISKSYRQSKLFVE